MRLPTLCLAARCALLVLVCLVSMSMAATSTHAVSIADELHTAMPPMPDSVVAVLGEAASPDVDLDETTLEAHDDDALFFLELATHIENAAELEAEAEHGLTLDATLELDLEADAEESTDDDAELDADAEAEDAADAEANSEDTADNETEVEADADADADADAEVETEVESEENAEFDAEFDAESEIEAESEVENEAEGEALTEEEAPTTVFFEEWIQPAFVEEVVTEDAAEDDIEWTQPELIESSSEASADTVTEITTESQAELAAAAEAEENARAQQALESTLEVEMDPDADHSTHALERPIIEGRASSLASQQQHASAIAQMKSLFDQAARDEPAVASAEESPYLTQIF